jgi:hypothetical protein
LPTVVCITTLFGMFVIIGADAVAIRAIFNREGEQPAGGRSSRGCRRDC